MPEIVLYGHLRKRFGRSFSLDVASAAEAVVALEANFPGRFFAALRRGHYRFVRGDRKAGFPLGVETLSLGLGSAARGRVL